MYSEYIRNALANETLDQHMENEGAIGMEVYTETYICANWALKLGICAKTDHTQFGHQIIYAQKWLQNLKSAQTR